jgi:crotonobetainyl-CoA:carnitine CoA-transferase CaiB-like acyl-CoA transferase
MTAAADEPLLSGLRVLDLGQGIAGPYCAAILQQQGAEVVKVEPPHGDWARKTGLTREGFSAVVLAYNAGKSGLCIDAGTAAGQAVLTRMAAQVDVVIQNFRAGVADRLNIGYEALRAVNPRLIYASISGFGPDGPLAALPATDTVMQAAGGLMWGNRDAANQPRRIGVYLADLATAMYAAQAISAALYRRSITGQGRHIELSLFEACCALQSSNIVDAVWSAGAPVPRTSTAPSGTFKVADGYITLAALDDAMFSRLCTALDLQQCLADPRFASHPSRLANADAINQVVAARLAGERMEDCARRLRDADVLGAQVLDYEALCSHPQARHAGLFGEIHNAGLPPLPRPRTPGGHAPATPETAPRVGQHSAQVLARFGFSEAEVAGLIAAGVVRQAT